jgi:hypothetical protein
VTTLGYRTFATRAEAERQRDALDVAAGYPRQTPLNEVRFVGRSARRIDPAKLRDEHVVDVQEGGGEFAIAVTTQADTFHGQVVSVRGEGETIDTRTGRSTTRPFDLRASGGGRS